MTSNVSVHQDRASKWPVWLHYLKSSTHSQELKAPITDNQLALLPQTRQFIADSFRAV